LQWLKLPKVQILAYAWQRLNRRFAGLGCRCSRYGHTAAPARGVIPEGDADDDAVLSQLVELLTDDTAELEDLDTPQPRP
jgi:hypothetical protein